jgi:hypothetical protein
MTIFPQDCSTFYRGERMGRRECCQKLWDNILRTFYWYTYFQLPIRFHVRQSTRSFNWRPYMSRLSMLAIYICNLFYCFVGHSRSGNGAVQEMEKSCLELDGDV